MGRNKAFADDELRELARIHLVYEADMLKWSAAILFFLTNPPIPDADSLPKVLSNGLIESFAVHARNLIEFLYRTPRTGHVGVQHYLDRPTLNQVLPPETDLLKNAYRKATNEVAHLSRERIKRYQDSRRGENVWSYIEITNEILASLAAVVPKIPPEKLNSDDSHLLSRAEPLFPLVDVVLEKDSDGDTVQVRFCLPNPLDYFGPSRLLDVEAFSRAHTGPVK